MSKNVKEADEQSQARSEYDASLCPRAGSYMVWFRNESPCIIMPKSKILYGLF